MTVGEILKILRNDGWEICRTKGSHRQLKHPVKSGLVTISGKSSHDVRKGTLASIYRQAGLK